MIILSMATMPIRKERLLENLPSLLKEQERDGRIFDKFYITIPNDIEISDHEFYEELKKLDDRIEIQLGDAKWRSCNKLLPTLEKHPNDVIITVDDDIYYPQDCLKMLLNEARKTEFKCIIAHEVNPIVVDDKDHSVRYVNTWDLKMRQREFGKYLTNCCLFPPHVFDGTDVFDYDKMMWLTDGLHDEMWFWVSTTLNGIQCVGLDYIKSFDGEIKRPWRVEEFRLGVINSNEENIERYNKRINERYGERLYDVISKSDKVINVDCGNVYRLLNEIDLLINFYYDWTIRANLTKWYVKLLEREISKRVVMKFVDNAKENKQASIS